MHSADLSKADVVAECHLDDFTDQGGVKGSGSVACAHDRRTPLHAKRDSTQPASAMCPSVMSTDAV